MQPPQAPIVPPDALAYNPPVAAAARRRDAGRSCDPHGAGPAAAIVTLLEEAW